MASWSASTPDGWSAGRKEALEEEAASTGREERSMTALRRRSTGALLRAVTSASPSTKRKLRGSGYHDRPGSVRASTGPALPVVTLAPDGRIDSTATPASRRPLCSRRWSVVSGRRPWSSEPGDPNFPVRCGKRNFSRTTVAISALRSIHGDHDRDGHRKTRRRASKRVDLGFEQTRRSTHRPSNERRPSGDHRVRRSSKASALRRRRRRIRRSSGLRSELRRGFEQSHRRLSRSRTMQRVRSHRSATK